MDARPTITALIGLSLLSGCMGGGDGLELTLGTMMPLTGDLSSIGKQMEEGAKLAMEEVNAAQVGIRIRGYHEDDRTGDSSAITGTFNRLVAQGVDGVVGPCCSGVTGSVLNLAVQEQVVVVTPSATSPSLVARGQNGGDINEGYFLRMPPSDAIQARVLARLVQNNNVTTVNMIVVNNAYGNALAQVFQQNYLGVVGKVERFAEQGTTSYSSQVDAACAAPTPQGIVLAVYTAAGAGILKEMQAKGCLSKVKIFASEGVYDEAASLATQAGKDTEGNFLAAGVKGTTPSAGDQAGYKSKFRARWGHDPLLYSPESYDGVMFITLAALAAKSTDASRIKEQFVSVANGGQKTSDFRQAAKLIGDGIDIDWVGQAHDFDYDDKHEPKGGVYAYWEIGMDGKMKTTQTGVTA